MFVEGLELTLIGMSSVFVFLLLLVGVMYAQAAIFKYLGVTDESEKPAADEDEALIAAAVAVKLKNG
ncbi:MAG: OadG family protein [Alphaproteobacteria bacterium]|nr:OadG family protein [Alphaproteobacteria bacterium]